MSERSDHCHTGTNEIFHCTKVLKPYRLLCDADVSMWFDDLMSHVHLIMPVLTEQVCYLLLSLSEEECSDYKTVKKAVLNELKLMPTEHFGMFEKASKRKN